jgi:arylesterase/paraoxonase
MLSDDSIRPIRPRGVAYLGDRGFEYLDPDSALRPGCAPSRCEAVSTMIRARRRMYSVLAVLAVLAALIVRIGCYAGEFARVRPHYAGTCTAIYGIPGAEDATIDPARGVALISSYDRRRYLAGEDAPGAIFGVDVHAARPVPVDLTAGFRRPFHPHGISRYVEPGGATWLFAINHTRAGNFVEIFEEVGGRLEHRESISDPALGRPNDLQAVGRRSFYVTIDHGSAGGLARWLEDLVPLRRSYVLYFDGRRMTHAATAIGGANGIRATRDGRTLYVAATTEKAIRVFDRDPGSGTLTPRAEIAVGGFPDNIELDDAGDLFVATVPQALSFLAHGANPARHAATRIVRVAAAGFTVDERYVDDGTAIDGATVAAPFAGGMLLGPSKDPRHQILICRDAGGAP